jgi:hypothetical protein
VSPHLYSIFIDVKPTNMIKSVFAVFIFFTVTCCNNNSTPSAATVDSTTDADHTEVKNLNGNTNPTDTLAKPATKTMFPDLMDWEIDEATVTRMSQAKCPFSTPEECNLKANKKYKKALRLIEAHYPILDWNYAYIPARFEEADVERYKRTRKRKDPANENVNGRATLILEVSPKDMALTTVKHYFDICIICPPPNTGTCDLSDPVAVANKK